MSKFGLTLSLLLAALFTTFLARGASCRGGAVTLKGAEQKMNKTLAAGVWGGEHLRMDVSEGGASLDFDCASGTIDRPIPLDGEGRFSVTGTYVTEHPGPVRRDEEADVRPVRYAGQVKGDTLTLAVAAAADSEEAFFEFTLTHGSEGRVMKCR